MNKKQFIAGGVAAVITTSLAVGVFAADTIKPYNKNYNTINKTAFVAPVNQNSGTLSAVYEPTLEQRIYSNEKIMHTEPLQPIISSAPINDNVIIGAVPNIPSVQAQVKGILDMFSFAENYSNLPLPPIADWRPKTTRIYLTDEEIRKIPEYGIPYGEAANKDENGRIYAVVQNEPPQELWEWVEKYNMKIPRINVPSLNSYENMMLNLIYLNSKWWLDLKAEIESNLEAYEKWFFNGEVPATDDIVYMESPNNFVYGKPFVKIEPVIENKQPQDPYPVIYQEAPNEIVQKAKDFIINKYKIPAEKVHLSSATSYTFQLTKVDLWKVEFYSIPETGKEDGTTVYINKADNLMTNVVTEGWTPFYIAEQKAEEKLCTKVKKDLYVKRRDMNSLSIG